jgi:uncharacterized iron-regulated membrane protein
MSVTGALLAFESQIVDALESDVRRVQPSDSSKRVGASTMLSAAAAAKPNVPPTGLTLTNQPEASVAITFGREGTVYVNPYSGEVLGEGASRARAVFQTLTSWHRWLGSEGPFRSTARAITGASNLFFLGLALSGIFLWLPRNWSRARVKAVLVFDGGARGKARDFNWHNVIGFWCAPVLIVLTATAVVMSYPWANNLLYRITGSTPPAAATGGGQGGGANGGRGGGAGNRQARENSARENGARESNRGRENRPDRNQAQVPNNLDLLISRAEQTMPTWGTMTVRLATQPNGPVSFMLTDATHWNSFARSQLALDASTGEVVRWDPYANNSLGQKARGWVRFGHTGELGGWPGQLIAGVACVGGSVLVWTGLALALRRFLAWRFIKRLFGGRTVPVSNAILHNERVGA